MNLLNNIHQHTYNHRLGRRVGNHVYKIPTINSYSIEGQHYAVLVNKVGKKNNQGQGEMPEYLADTLHLILLHKSN
jgi:hypothetical protein